MPDSALPRFAGRASPLESLWKDFHAATIDGQVAVCELPFLAQVNLRGNVNDSGFRDVVRRCLDLDLPTVPNTVNSIPSLSALWLGPDEWLLVGEPGSEDRIVTKCGEALATLHSSIVDVSADRTVIEVSGGRSRDLLAKGCSIDLHPRAFAVGQCAQTNFSRAQVIVTQTNNVPTWRLFVRSSFASYLALWLMDAMKEYSVDAKSPSHFNPRGII
jgi:sarcosine oxidase, subunit gamma